MRLNPFKKDPVKKEQDVIYKEIKANTLQEIKEIEKIVDPAARVTRYYAAKEKLQQFYNDGKPETLDLESAIPGGGIGVMGGLFVGMAATATLTAPVGVPILLGTMAAGAFGAGKLFNSLDTKQEREKLTEKYGSVANARDMYKLQKTLEKKIKKDTDAQNDVKAKRALEKAAEKEARKKAKAEKKAELKEAPIRSLNNLQDHFNKAFNDNEPAPVQETPAAEKKVVLRKPQAPQA